MINHSNQTLTNIQFTWQSILWRLVLTALLLLILAGSGMTIFSKVTTRPDAQVLPTLTHQTGTLNTEH
jgi:hypothetical protein